VSLDVLVALCSGSRASVRGRVGEKVPATGSDDEQALRTCSVHWVRF